MKKRILFITGALLLTVAAIFTSCSKSEDTTPTSQPPSINFVAASGFISGDATLTVGEMFKVKVAAFANTTSGSKLTRLLVTRVFNNTPQTVQDTTFSLPSFTAEFTAQAQLTKGSETWFFRVTDKANQSAEISLIITTVNAAGPINSFDLKILGAQSSLTGSSFASIDGSVYQLAEAKANQTKVDWMYYYGASDLATLAAPDDAHAALVFTNATNGLQTWTTKNATRFKVVTDVINWDAITDDEVIIAQTSSGVTESRIPALMSGSYLAFVTASGKKGLIKVDNIVPGDTGEITISVKVQQ